MLRGEIRLVDLEPVRPGRPTSVVRRSSSAMIERIGRHPGWVVGSAIAVIPADHMERLDDALRLHLQL